MVCVTRGIPQPLILIPPFCVLCALSPPQNRVKSSGGKGKGIWGKKRKAEKGIQWTVISGKWFVFTGGSRVSRELLRCSPLTPVEFVAGKHAFGAWFLGRRSAGVWAAVWRSISVLPTFSVSAFSRRPLSKLKGVPTVSADNGACPSPGRLHKPPRRSRPGSFASSGAQGLERAPAHRVGLLVLPAVDRLDLGGRQWRGREIIGLPDALLHN